MKFPYLKFPAQPTEAFPNRHNTLRPVLPLKLKYNSNQLDYFALIDSGADHSIFHAGIGEGLGLSVKNGNKLHFWGIYDKKQLAYFHKITINIGGHDYKCYCGFSYEIESLPYGLLGQDDFFKQFKIILDYSKKQFEMKEKIK
jgi:hypothetical protein